MLRAYLVEARLPDFKALLERMAKDRRAYHLVDKDELDRVTASLHHEGVCFYARPRPELDLESLRKSLEKQAGPRRVVVLDRVENPNNVGAILRVAAHFGASAVVYTTPDGEPIRSSAIQRTAEGAAERVDLVFAPDVWEALDALDGAGFEVVGTSGRGEEALWSKPLPARMALLLGSEAEGVDEALLARIDRVISIPGTGAVESLNVSCAAAVILGEAWRAAAPTNAR